MKMQSTRAQKQQRKEWFIVKFYVCNECGREYTQAEAYKNQNVCKPCQNEVSLINK